MDEPNILTECALFRGLRRAQIREMLPCLSARQARFRRGQFLLRAGDRASSAGIILSGEAEVLQEDFWGNRNLLAAVGPGELFAEAFACAHAVSPVSVQCTTDGSVLYRPKASAPRSPAPARAPCRWRRFPGTGTRCRRS